MNYSQKEQKLVNSLQVLEFLFKLQKLRLCPEITIFDGDFIIHFDDIHGRDMTESVIITKESIWNGYGWSFDELISALDKKIEDGVRTLPKLTTDLPKVGGSVV